MFLGGNGMRRVKVQTQYQENDCGACCLAMILTYYGHNIETTAVAQKKDTSCGWNMKELKEVAETYNLKARAIQVLDIEGLYSCSFPLIIYWNFSHFVILERIEKDFVTIIDPNFGKRTLNIKDFKEHFSKYALYLHPDEKFSKNKCSYIQKLKQFKESKVWNLPIPYVYIFLSILYNIMLFITPIITSEFIQAILNQNFNFIYMYLLIPLVMIIFFLNYYLELHKNKTKIQLEELSTKNILENIFSRNLTELRRYQSGDILSRIYMNSDICNLIAIDIPNVISSLLLIVSISTYLLFIDKWIAFMMIGVILILMVFNFIFIIPMLNLASNEAFCLSEFRTNITEGIVSLKFLKSSGITTNYLSELYKTMNKYINSSNKKNTTSSGAIAVQQVTTLFFSLLISIVGFGLISIYPDKIKNITLVITMGMILFSPCIQILSALIRIFTIYPNIQRILEIVENKKETKIKKINKINSGNISISNLTFSYEGMKTPLFSNFNLSISDGEKIVICGKSGSGKTTLVHLLLGLEKIPYSGKIIVGGIDILSGELNLRDDICYISQSDKIFRGNLENNLRLHCDYYSFSTLLEVLNKLSLFDCGSAIVSPKQIHISENGNNFSSGQKQRLYLLRLFLKKYKIIIVDEPTSNLDSTTAQVIFEELDKLDCTQIIITHDEKVIKKEKRIVRIN